MSFTLFELSQNKFFERTTRGSFEFSGGQHPLQPRAWAVSVE
jgi:hypothetical protein